MSDQPESLSAILAEMRDPCAPRAPSLPAIADRIEAAVNLREHNLGVMLATRRRDLDTVIRENEAIREQRDNLLAAHEYDRRALVAATSPGNAAAMRAALERLLRFLQWMYAQEGRSADVGRGRLSDEIDVAVSALDAPCRNCDRPFRLVEEAIGAYVTERGDGPHLGYCDAIKWMLDPAEGGAE